MPDVLTLTVIARSPCVQRTIRSDGKPLVERDRLDRMISMVSLRQAYIDPVPVMLKQMAPLLGGHDIEAEITHWMMPGHGERGYAFKVSDAWLVDRDDHLLHGVRVFGRWEDPWAEPDD